MSVKRPENWDELVDMAKRSPDFPAIVERIIGMPLIQQRYRSKTGATIYKTKAGTTLRSDYSALNVFYNPDRGWYALDHKGRINGDAIAVVQQHLGYDYDRAVYFLAGADPGKRAERKSFEKQREKISALSPTQSGPGVDRRVFTPLRYSTGREETKRVRAYLGKTRGIPYPLIDLLLKQGLIGEAPLNPYGRKPACVVFNCFDEAGTLRGQMWRSTLSSEYITEKNAPYQKGNVAGSDIAFPWIFTYRPEGAAPALTVICEAPIDAISLCAITGLPAHYVAMGGLNLNTLETVKQRFGEDITISVDNDAAGREFVGKWLKIHPEDEGKVALPELAEVLDRDRIAGREKADWNQNLLYRLEHNAPIAFSPDVASLQSGLSL